MYASLKICCKLLTALSYLIVQSKFKEILKLHSNNSVIWKVIF